ncbi:MAG: YHS domain-containing (seleno)protein [Pseudomonadales bacterium]
MKKVLIAVSLILVAGALGFAAKGKIAPLSWGLWGEVNLESGVGSGGYDVVSYHTQGAAMRGLEQYSSEYQGARWHFSNAQNKDAFDKNPERYVPRYGGFCAFAVYNNVTADASPTVWHIEEGKLYLFASDGPKRDWIEKIADGAIVATDQNWAQR